VSRIKQVMHIGYSPRNRVELIRGGKPYFTRLEQLIQEAKQSLHLQFYIFEPDATGDHILEKLSTAAQRGVQVFLHLDAYASAHLDNSRVEQLRKSGAEIKWFEPLLRSTRFYIGRRMHHKIVVADGVKLLIGGLNICDRYNDLPNEPAWFDMAAYLEGETAYIAYHQ
jgi:cardiolipin synthase